MKKISNVNVKRRGACFARVWYYPTNGTSWFHTYTWEQKNSRWYVLVTSITDYGGVPDWSRSYLTPEEALAAHNIPGPGEWTKRDGVLSRDAALQDKEET